MLKNRGRGRDDALSAPRHQAGRGPVGIGFLAGLLNGLIALGGGIIITPMLVADRGVSPQVAVGTSLAAVVVFSSVSFVVHSAFGSLMLGPVALATTILAGIAGGYVGGRLLSRLSARWMLLIFSVLVFLMAGKLFAQGLGVPLVAPPTEGAVPVWAFGLLGLMAGVMSGVLGVGGGALVLLGLAAFFGMPVQSGLPLALALNVTNALFGAFRHARAGRVLWLEVRVLIPSAMIGIVAGCALAVWLPPDGLRVVVGGFFLLAGTRLARQALRMENG